MFLTKIGETCTVAEDPNACLKCKGALFFVEADKSCVACTGEGKYQDGDFCRDCHSTCKIIH